MILDMPRSQFPTTSELLAMRAAVFDVGMFAVIDHTEADWDDDGKAGWAPHEAHGGASGGAAAAERHPMRLYGGALTAFASCTITSQISQQQQQQQQQEPDLGDRADLPSDSRSGDGGGGGPRSRVTRGKLPLRTVLLPASGGLVERATLATATNGSVALPLFRDFQRMSKMTMEMGKSTAGVGLSSADSPPSPCPEMEGPADALRRAVDGVGRAYARLLDRLVHGVSSR